jgi:hypothetical protein
MSGNNLPSAQKEFDEINAKQAELASLYKKYFPKADPHLVEDLVVHGSSSGNGNDRLYSVQVMAADGTDSAKAREYFLSKTGKAPAEYEEGRHYVLSLYLTLDMLKELQGNDVVEHITGDYTFGSYSVNPSHKHRGPDEESRVTDA